jgi:transcriptional regulator with XRE-family HTH domain
MWRRSDCMNCEALKNKRTERELTRREAAAQLGITEQTLYLLETESEKVTTTEILGKLADFYGVTTDFILGREDGAV